MSSIALSQESPPSLTESQLYFPRGSQNLLHGRYRWLQGEDEDHFQKLLQAVYAGTYSYKELYRDGGYRRLIESGRIEALGEFSSSGDLISHTAFIFKDPKCNYLEQGMAFKHPDIRFSGKNEQADVFARVMRYFTSRFSFIHQNVTTYHPFAQTFARRYMGAAISGFIANYASNEAIRKMHHSSDPMHAVTMTTTLDAGLLSDQSVFVPNNRWGDWLLQIYKGLALPRSLHLIEASENIARSTGAVDSSPLTVIEANSALKLRRRCLEPMNSIVEPSLVSLEALVPDKTNFEIELLHLPLADKRHVATTFPALLRAGYRPVGVRPHSTRPDEALFQFFGSALSACAQSIAQAKIARPADHALIQKWRTLCSAE